MSKTHRKKGRSSERDEAGGGQEEKGVHKPKPGSGAALNKVYKAMCQAVCLSVLAERKE